MAPKANDGSGRSAAAHGSSRAADATRWVPPRPMLVSVSAASLQRQDHLHDPADVALFPISLAGVGVFVVAFHTGLVHDVGRGVAQRGNALIRLETIIGARGVGPQMAQGFGLEGVARATVLAPGERVVAVK